LQNTVFRAQQITSQVFIVSEISHADEVAKQLPQLPKDRLIVEPGRRGTASCIILALARLKKLGYPDSEVVVFLAADQHIVDNEKFLEAVRAAATASETERKMALIGVEPTYAATGFGYIELAKRLREDIYDVASFHEKPTSDKAEEYYKSQNYLWNLSLFAAPQHIFESNIKDYAPDLSIGYQKLLSSKSNDEESEVYLRLKPESIDYALIENIPETIVVAGKFGWADLGSFGDLYEVLRADQPNVNQGKVVEMLDCDNSMVLGHSDRPVVAIGLKDVVIVDSPDGLLVVEASQAQRVKEALANLKARKEQ
jgi:mannose-1-phosphate guanylyltransferase